MTRRYQITQSDTGTDLGTFAAEDEAGALDALARELGYEDFEDAREALGHDPRLLGELRVTRMARYTIECLEPHGWTAQNLGHPRDRTFDSEEEAEDGVLALRDLGDGWETAEYRVVQLDG